MAPAVVPGCLGLEKGGGRVGWPSGDDRLQGNAAGAAEGRRGGVDGCVGQASGEAAPSRPRVPFGNPTSPQWGWICCWTGCGTPCAGASPSAVWGILELKLCIAAWLLLAGCRGGGRRVPGPGPLEVTVGVLDEVRW